MTFFRFAFLANVFVLFCLPNESLGQFRRPLSRRVPLTEVLRPIISLPGGEVTGGTPQVPELNFVAHLICLGKEILKLLGRKISFQLLPLIGVLPNTNNCSVTPSTCTKVLNFTTNFNKLFSDCPKIQAAICAQIECACDAEAKSTPLTTYFRSRFDYTINFTRSRFDYTINYFRSRFDYTINFTRSRFDYTINYTRSRFDYTINFTRSRFDYTINFTRSRFDYTIHYTKSRFDYTIKLSGIWRRMRRGRGRRRRRRRWSRRRRRRGMRRRKRHGSLRSQVENWLLKED